MGFFGGVLVGSEVEAEEPMRRYSRRERRRERAEMVLETVWSASRDREDILDHRIEK